MRTALLLLGAMGMVSIVSGDAIVKVSATLGDTALLPWNCSRRNESKDLKWQKVEEKGEHNVLRDTRYKGRFKTFVAEDSSDCSLQLTNITADDQGTYICRFHTEIYNDDYYVNLIIYANYRLCQEKLKGDGSDSSFQCEAEGHYREAQIQWFSEKTNLTNVSTNDPVREASGSYLFKSILTTHHNLTSEPKCDVKTRGISANVSRVCKGTSDLSKQHQPQYSYLWWFTIVPVVLVLGLILVLWRRRKSSQSVENNQVLYQICSSNSESSRSGE